VSIIEWNALQGQLKEHTALLTALEAAIQDLSESLAANDAKLLQAIDKKVTDLWERVADLEGRRTRASLGQHLA
jgi:chromosome segregation ATPase